MERKGVGVEKRKKQKLSFSVLVIKKRILYLYFNMGAISWVKAGISK